MFKVLQSMVGNTFSHIVGDIIAWDDQADADRMVAAGILERVGPKPPETATISNRKQKETR